MNIGTRAMLVTIDPKFGSKLKPYEGWVGTITKHGKRCGKDYVRIDFDSYTDCGCFCLGESIPNTTVWAWVDESWLRVYGKVDDIIEQKRFVLQSTFCPHCSSRNIKESGDEQTLVGYTGDSPEDDPNHHWVNCECQNCNTKFVKQYKSGNMWLTHVDRMQCFKGISNCFEYIIYKCKKCNGNVVEKLYNLDGTPYGSTMIPGTEESMQVISIKMGIKPGESAYSHRKFWECADCNNRIEVEPR
jgi:hypothetical protein